MFHVEHPIQQIPNKGRFSPKITRVFHRVAGISELNNLASPVPPEILGR